MASPVDPSFGVGGPVDPGFGVDGSGPVDPGFGNDTGNHPWVPGHLPPPPPGIWPPPNATLPIVPAPPDTPPGAIWPPIGNPPIWSGGVDRPGGGESTQPLPPGKFWIVAGIPGVGWRYVCVEPQPVTPQPK